MKHTVAYALILSYSFLALPNAAQGQARGPNSQNRFYFEETFFPVYVSKNDANNVAGGAATKSVPTESGLGYDARTTLGYIWNNVLFGLTFNLYQVDTSRARTADYEGLNSETSKQEFGPTLGYILGNWRFALTYFVSGSKAVTQKYTDTTTGAVTTDETYKNGDGSGFQFAIGYDFAIGAGFSISPTLIYRSLKYGEQSYIVRTGAGTPYPTTSLRTEAVDDELTPMITFSYSL